MTIAVSRGTQQPPETGVASREGKDNVPLTSIKRGQMAQVVSASLSPEDASLLGAMGLCTRAIVRVFRVARWGGPCVVAVGGVRAHLCGCGGMCRIGLTRELAERITVVPVA